MLAIYNFKHKNTNFRIQYTLALTHTLPSNKQNMVIGKLVLRCSTTMAITIPRSIYGNRKEFVSRRDIFKYIYVLESDGNCEEKREEDKGGERGGREG